MSKMWNFNRKCGLFFYKNGLLIVYEKASLFWNLTEFILLCISCLWVVQAKTPATMLLYEHDWNESELNTKICISSPVPCPHDLETLNANNCLLRRCNLWRTRLWITELMLDDYLWIERVVSLNCDRKYYLDSVARQVVGTRKA